MADILQRSAGPGVRGAPRHLAQLRRGRRQLSLSVGAFPSRFARAGGPGAALHSPTLSEALGRSFAPSRTEVRLLYPIGTKNYASDPFIQNEWVQLRVALETAYLVTIFGYAAPESDCEAKSLMLDPWGASPPRELGEIDIVDVKPRSQLDATWASFAKGSHYSTSTDLGWLYEHARRSCDHFALMTLQQRICRTNPLPKTDDLRALHAWVKTLADEEDALERNGTPFPC